MSRIETIRPSASQNAIESGISVSFIQNAPTTGSSHTNAIPSYGERLSRPISPVSRSAGVSATWTSSETGPAAGPVGGRGGAGGVRAPPGGPARDGEDQQEGGEPHPSIVPWVRGGSGLDGVS